MQEVFKEVLKYQRSFWRSSRRFKYKLTYNIIILYYIIVKK